MTPPAAGFSYFAVFNNYPLAAAVLGFAVAQSIKFFVTWYKENRWDPKQLIGSGGMPSSHSATVTALAVAIGFQDGFGSALFATAAIFASVVMYDASGIRLHAGKQAEISPKRLPGRRLPRSDFRPPPPPKRLPAAAWLVVDNTYEFDLSRALLRTGKRNNVADSMFGARYTTTAKMYKDGR